MSIKALKHFKTITHHKFLVMKGCFKVGLYKQGLLHDISKYSLQEFITSVKYYQGDKSPVGAERKEKGYSSIWLHHKGRNKHHFEYWFDIEGDKLVPLVMPDKYIIEMFIDRIAAAKVYNGKNYTNNDPLIYHIYSKSDSLMHPLVRFKLKYLLNKLVAEGEEKTFKYIKDNNYEINTFD